MGVPKDKSCLLTAIKTLEPRGFCLSKPSLEFIKVISLSPVMCRIMEAQRGCMIAQGTQKINSECDRIRTWDL